MFRVLPAYLFDKETGLREKLRIAKVGEFEGIDIEIEEIYTLTQTHSPAYVKGMFESFNLKVGIWELPFSLTSDHNVYEKGLAKLDDYARTASYIEAFRVATFVDKKMLKSNINLYQERLVSVAGILSDYGCRIGIGFEDENDFIPSEITKLLKKIKTGNTGFIFSARAWHLSGGKEGELRRIPKGEIIYVVVGDVSEEGNGKYLPGETKTINLPLFLNTLAEIDYDGPVAPEMPDREILTIPAEISVRLLGGSLLKVWNRTFKQK